MNSPIDREEIKELLRRKKDGNLYHRESQTLEFKESFSFSGLPEYCRDFAALANNRGGYLILGVKDRPKRERVGLRDNSLAQFNKLDPEYLSGQLIEVFSPEIVWQHDVFKLGGLHFGVFYVHEAAVKPVICKKDHGKNQELRNGDIYYRYGGRTQRIQFAELENIISNRVDQNNSHWMDLIQKIASAGPQNAAILDTEKGLIEKNTSQILVVDEDLVKDMQWIREGEFSEKKGERTLKLVGSVHPIDQVEVVRKVKENKLKEYPLTATDLVNEIKRRNRHIRQGEVYRIISENRLKENKEYSTYVFRNNKQQEAYDREGLVPGGIPSIYKTSAIDYIVRVYEGEE